MVRLFIFLWLKTITWVFNIYKLNALIFKYFSRLADGTLQEGAVHRFASLSGFCLMKGWMLLPLFPEFSPFVIYLLFFFSDRYG